MIKPISLAVLLGAAALSSCGDSAVQEITAPAAESRVRFFNFGVNAPAVNFYAGTSKLTAVSSTTGTESTLGTSYGVAASGGFYSAVAPGDYTLTARISATVDKDLAIATVTQTIASGKSYSVYMSGFYNVGTKTVEAFAVEDPYPAAIDYAFAQVRFVNAISNSSPMILYAKNTTSLLEGQVGDVQAYKAAGAFTPVPTGVYDLSTRLAGSGTNIITRTGVSFVAGRIYTITARGDITVVSATATNRPILDNTPNR
ncbi:MAG: DUF4397 domain-containing protein [Gemmatimonadetes bacterium]|nr:DUF4397 domain-containing protein [Gemmatimonadota bacterium]